MDEQQHGFGRIAGGAVKVEPVTRIGSVSAIDRQRRHRSGQRVLLGIEQRLARREHIGAERGAHRSNRAGRVGHSATTGLVNVPTVPIDTSTVSPAFMYSGGVRLSPTPPGVPVAITSPGSSVVKVEQ